MSKAVDYYRLSPFSAVHPDAAIEESVYKVPKNFQLLLDQFNNGISFKKLLRACKLEDDQFLYEIETTQGAHYYIFEIDFLKSFQSIREKLEGWLGEKIHFVEAIFQPVKFSDCPPSQFYVGKNPVPIDFDLTKKYFNWKHGTENYYFNFLFKKRESDRLPFESAAFELVSHGKAKHKTEVEIPRPLIWFLRTVQEDIKANQPATLIPSMGSLRCQYVFGGLVEENGDPFFRDTYKFIYFPTFAAKNKKITCRWVLYLTRAQIAEIASDTVKTLFLWSCNQSECECKYSLQGQDCRHEL
ncbi:MAG TPA: hypothetical protein DEP87_02155 [Candidatus Pacebacteria bacterium]|nr:hypothetical protein [Candidatus Paceibacterota bacterium]